MARKGMSERIIVVALYLSLNSALNLLNRWALHSSGFSFPLVMTASHMFFSVICLAPVLLRSLHYRAKHVEVMESFSILRGLAVVGLFNGLQIALNNASLMFIELSMNQVIRAFIPVIVALFSVCIEYKVPDRRQAVALFAVSIGVVIAVFEEVRARALLAAQYASATMRHHPSPPAASSRACPRRPAHAHRARSAPSSASRSRSPRSSCSRRKCP